MNSKIFLKVISLVMAASIVLTVGGCKKDDTVSDDTTAESKTQEVVDYKITWKSVTSSRFDSTAFKKAMPELAERFTRSTTSRRFVVA